MLKPSCALSFKGEGPVLFSSAAAIGARNNWCGRMPSGRPAAATTVQRRFLQHRDQPFSAYDTRPFMRPARWRRWKSVPPSIATPTRRAWPREAPTHRRGSDGRRCCNRRRRPRTSPVPSGEARLSLSLQRSFVTDALAASRARRRLLPRQSGAGASDSFAAPPCLSLRQPIFGNFSRKGTDVFTVRVACVHASLLPE